MAIKFESEKDMEDFLMDNRDFMNAEFELEGYELHRQLNLGVWGVPDITAIQVFTDPDGDTYCNIEIFELKNTTLSHQHVSQVARYREFFERLRGEFDSFHVYGHLIGLPTFPGSGDLVFLCQAIDWLSVYELEFSPFAGMSIKPICGWVKVGSEEVEKSILEAIKIPENVISPLKAANEEA